LSLDVVMLLAFLTVMIVVPLIMVLGRPVEDSSAATDRPPAAPSRSLFTSGRERRLWMWTLAVLVAIYATLGPVRELADFLRERNLLRLSSAAVLVTLSAVIATQWLRTRPGPREIATGIGVVAVYIASLIRIPIPEERTHLFEYGLVAILIYQALLERRANGRPLPLPAVVAWAAAVLLGWLDEGIQSLLPNRVYDLVDVGFNAVAATMAIAAILLLGWARRWDVFNRESKADE